MYICLYSAVASFDVNLKNGLDFAVYGGKDSSSGAGAGSVLLVLLIDDDSKWTTIKISYLASARNDFTLGSYTISTSLLSQGSSNGGVTSLYTIPQWTSSAVELRIAIQIAGIKVTASTFSAELTSVVVDKQTGLIALGMTLQSSPLIEYLVITYVLWKNTAPISYSYYSVDQASGSPYNFIGLDSISSQQAVLAGNGFGSAGPIVSPIQGLTCVGPRCTKECLASQECTTNGGVA
jgi:hypothetical protein